MRGEEVASGRRRSAEELYVDSYSEEEEGPTKKSMKKSGAYHKSRTNQRNIGSWQVVPTRNVALEISNHREETT